MAMEPEQTLLFEQGYIIKINSASNPFYYFFDWYLHFLCYFLRAWFSS